MVFAYNEFNKSVDEKEITINVLLINLLKKLDQNYENNKEIYEKLKRNLLIVLKKKNSIMSSNDYCRYLYQWIYHTKKRININEYPLSMFYVTSRQNIVSSGGENICLYYSYDTTFEEPLKIIKLENFQENINIIESIVKN
ncbi:hypothetical protein PVMG_04530 [Plasmodium vivax Mauritania I]|uniref:Uncharacterized protein n=2 Tax=Plasmodium vivax TaxID=5855 RepID=A0A0J9T2Q8_PLAVI|nr:hypothetical protein PVBG_04766 [Plasmodium vivax Brazil I]KMZ89700.1 hypothetical protein PVMG_04530 [Plasmodium vivax Mauritania I]